MTINKIIRAMVKKPKYDMKTRQNTPSKPIYKELQILTLNNLYYYNLGILAHTFQYSLNLPDKIAEKFVKKKDIVELSTRNNEYELYYNVPKKDTTFRKPTLASSILWNKLPDEIKAIKSKPLFKDKLKQFLLNRI